MTYERRVQWSEWNNPEEKGRHICHKADSTMAEQYEESIKNNKKSCIEFKHKFVYQSFSLSNDCCFSSLLFWLFQIWQKKIDNNLGEVCVPGKLSWLSYGMFGSIWKIVWNTMLYNIYCRNFEHVYFIFVRRISASEMIYCCSINIPFTCRRIFGGVYFTIPHIWEWIHSYAAYIKDAADMFGNSSFMIEHSRVDCRRFIDLFSAC